MIYKIKNEGRSRLASLPREKRILFRTGTNCGLFRKGCFKRCYRFSYCARPRSCLRFRSPIAFRKKALHPISNKARSPVTGKSFGQSLKPLRMMLTNRAGKERYPFTRISKRAIAYFFLKKGLISHQVLSKVSVLPRHLPWMNQW